MDYNMMIILFQDYLVMFVWHLVLRMCNSFKNSRKTAVLLLPIQDDLQ